MGYKSINKVNYSDLKDGVFAKRLIKHELSEAECKIIVSSSEDILKEIDKNMSVYVTNAVKYNKYKTKNYKRSH